MLYFLTVNLVWFEGDAASASDNEEGSESHDSGEDNLSDIEHSTDDDGDDDVGGDDDVDTPGDEKGDLSSQDCTEPPAKKRVHFADAVEIEKSTAVTVSYLYHILLTFFFKNKTPFKQALCLGLPV